MTRLRRGAVARGALLSALVMALVACGSVAGTAQPGGVPGGPSITTGSSVGTDTSEPSDDPDPSSADPTPDDPSPSDDPAGPEPLTELDPVDESIGRWLEARRIANQMPSPTQIDPSLTIKVIPTQPLQDNFGLVLDDPGTQVIQNVGGFQAGFVAARRSVDNATSMVVMVLEFATPEEAAAVAAQLPLTDPEHVPLTAGVPGAVLTSKTWTDTVAVVGTSASGTLVHYVYVGTAPGVDGQPLAEQALTTLTEAMSGFRVTPAQERIALPDDVDGILTHTLGGFTKGESGWYTAAGALHFQYDHARAENTFSRAGVDLVSVGVVNVYRAADPSGARLIQADFLSETTTVGGYTDIDIEGLPESTSCLDAGSGSTYCVGTTGRYAFEYTWEERDEVAKIAQKQQSLLEQF